MKILLPSVAIPLFALSFASPAQETSALSATEQFKRAVETRDTQLLKSSIDAGLELTQPVTLNPFGMPSYVLNHCVSEVYDDCVDLLVEEGARITAGSLTMVSEWAPRVHRAIKDGDERRLQSYLSVGLELTGYQFQYPNLMEMAVEVKQPIMIDVLREAGYLNSDDYNQSSTLSKVLSAGYLEQASGLVDHGWRLSEFEDLSELVRSAIDQQNATLLELIFSAGLDIDADLNSSSQRPLAYAIDSGVEDKVRLLLELGASTARLNSWTSNAVALALQRDQPEIALYLIDQGADLELDAEGFRRPIDVALEKLAAEVFVALVDRGAKPDRDIADFCDYAVSNGQLDRVTFCQSIGQVDSVTELVSPMLLGAIKQGNLDQVRELLDAGAAPDELIADDLDNLELPMILAAKEGHLEIMQLLAERGAEYLSTNQAGDNAFNEAADWGQAAVVKFLFPLVEASPDADWMQQRALKAGISRNDRTLFDTLIGLSVEPDRDHLKTSVSYSRSEFFNQLAPFFDLQELDENGNSLLHLLARTSRFGEDRVTPETLEIGDQLVAAGVDLAQKNDDGNTAIHRLFANRSPDESEWLLVLWLIDQGLSVPADCCHEKVLSSLESDDLNMAERLLEAGASPSSVGANGTPLLSAMISSGRDAGTSMVMRFQPDVDALDRITGLAPLHLAVETGNLDLVGTLIKQGADLEVRSTGRQGKTPLMAAVERDDEAQFDLLISAGASPYARDRQGLTLTDYLRSGGVSPLSAKIEAMTANDATPLEVVLYPSADIDATEVMSYSPDGRLSLRVADQRLELWDEVNRRALRQIGNTSTFFERPALADFLDNERMIIALGGSEPLQVIDVYSGNPLEDVATNDRYLSWLNQSEWVGGAALSADKKLLAVSSRSTPLAVFDTETLKEIRRWEVPELKDLRFHDNFRLTGLDGQSLYTVDVTSDDPARVFDQFEADSLSSVTAVAVNTQGIAVSYGESRLMRDSAQLHIWDINTGIRTARVPSPKVTAITFVGDEEFVTGDEDGGVTLWRLHPLKQVWNTQVSDANDIAGLATEADKIFASADEEGVVVLEGSSGKEVGRLRKNADWGSFTEDLLLLGDGRLAMANGEQVEVWQWEESKRLAKQLFKEGVRGMSVTPSGELAVSTGNLLSLHRLRDLKRLREVTLFEPGEPNGFNCLFNDWATIKHQWNNEGALFFGCFSTGPLIWQSGKETQLAGDSVGVGSLAVSADRKYLLTGHNAIRYPAILTSWDSESFNVSRSMAVDYDENPRISSAALAGDLLLTGSYERQAIELWSLENHRYLGELHSGLYSQQVVGIAADSSGGRAISWGNGSVKLWDLAARRFISVIDPDGDLRRVALSPDGESIAISFVDTPRIELWDFKSGSLKLTLESLERPVEHLSFSRDSRSLIVSERHLLIFDLMTGQRSNTFNSLQGWVNQAYEMADGRIIAEHIEEAQDLKLKSVIKFWRSPTDVETGPQQALLTLDTAGERFATRHNNTVSIWAGDQETRIDQVSGYRVAAQFINEGLLLSDDAMTRYHLDGDVSYLATPIEPRSSDETASRVLSYSDDRSLAMYYKDGKMRVFDTGAAEELACLKAPVASVSSAAFAREPRQLQIKAVNGDSRTYSLPGTECVSSAGTVSASTEGMVTVFRQKTSREPMEIKTLASRAVISQDERLLALASSDNRLVIVDLEAGRATHLPVQHQGIAGLTFSPSGDHLAVHYYDDIARVFETSQFQPIAQWYIRYPDIKSFKLNDEHLEVESAQAIEVQTTCSPFCNTEVVREKVALQRFDVKSGDASTLNVVTRVPAPDNPPRFTSMSVADSYYSSSYSGLDARAYASKDGRWHASGTDAISVWRDGVPLSLDYEYATPGYETEISYITYLKDNGFLLVVRRHGEVELIDLEQLQKVASLNLYQDGHWLAMDQAGRYDSDTPGDLPYAAWVASDDPLTALPIEVFLNEFFEPRLIPRILNREFFAEVTSIADINRVQPEVRIDKVAPSAADPGTVELTLTINNQVRQLRGVDQAAGVREVRVFRNGQQVAFRDDFADLAPGESRQLTISGIRLPKTSEPDYEFSAHAFNLDGIKSLTATRTTALNRADNHSPKAYVITIGVDEYENASWDLQYAAADAIAIAENISASLTELDRYEDITVVPLISGDAQPTRARIKAVFDLMAGRKVDPLLVSSIPGAEALRRIHPDDFVLVSFSGHGYAEANGNFHLFPFDIGSGDQRAMGSGLLTRTVTSGDLDEWLRDIDAGEFVFIIDACNSAASVEGSGFKPGPMGSRGLGQLAYNKGMKVLTASQAESVALESQALRHGLLTYSLIREGIESGRARDLSIDDAIDTREWLSYGQQRVPELYEALLTDPGSIAADRGFDAVIAVEERAPVIQRPSLFDFSRAAPRAIAELPRQPAQ